MSIIFSTIDAQLIAFPDYDDRAAVEDYFARHAEYFMTDFEKRCVRLGVAREKVATSSVARNIWESESDREVEQALRDGVWEYQIAVRRRLLSMYEVGTISVNRCPKCMRVLRTPLAQQCRWCKHTWRAT